MEEKDGIILSARQGDAIKHILARFDFGRVQQSMKALKWTWGGHTPTREEMKDTARHLLAEACNDPALYCSGGFEADGANCGLRLTFVVAEAKTAL